MAKAKVTFKPVRIAEGDWNILAECPDRKPVQIISFKTEIDEWMNGDRRIASLRSQGYAKLNGRGSGSHQGCCAV